LWLPISDLELNSENNKMVCSIYILLPSVVFFHYIKKLRFFVLPLNVYKLLFKFTVAFFLFSFFTKFLKRSLAYWFETFPLLVYAFFLSFDIFRPFKFIVIEDLLVFKSFILLFSIHFLFLIVLFVFFVLLEHFFSPSGLIYIFLNILCVVFLVVALDIKIFFLQQLLLYFENLLNALHNLCLFNISQNATKMLLSSSCYTWGN
jgi:hypothetical protein